MFLHNKANNFNPDELHRYQVSVRALRLINALMKLFKLAIINLILLDLYTISCQLNVFAEARNER